MKKFILLTFLLTIPLLLTACGSGETAYEFKVKDIQGKTVQLLEDKPTLLFFAASWCPTCPREERVLKEVYKLYGDKVQLVTVEMDPVNSTVEGLSEFQKRFGDNWSHVFDKDYTLTKGYGVNQIEVVIIIDQNKQIAFRGLNPSVKRIKNELANIGVN
jgi:thiol-disulfide isomerase/thioredoxin